MAGIDPGVLLAQRLNDLVLALALVGVVAGPAAVARDARRSGLSRAHAALWAAVSLLLFPLGVALPAAGEAGEPDRQP